MCRYVDQPYMMVKLAACMLLLAEKLTSMNFKYRKRLFSFYILRTVSVWYFIRKLWFHSRVFIYSSDVSYNHSSQLHPSLKMF